MMNDALLEFHSVSKRYRTAAGDIIALNNIDLVLNSGEFVFITGPSGSGKSTLLNLAALLDRQSHGQVCFDGYDTQVLSESQRCELRQRSIGMIFQNYQLLIDRTVLDNVMFRFRYTQTSPSQARAAALHALELTGLSRLAGQKARLLSGGEMQRVAIARAIAVQPRLLAADEPTGNLDAASAKSVMQCLSDLNQSGTAILFVTHNESLLEYSNRHILFTHGNIECDCAHSNPIMA